MITLFKVITISTFNTRCKANKFKNLICKFFSNDHQTQKFVDSDYIPKLK